MSEAAELLASAADWAELLADSNKAYPARALLGRSGSRCLVAELLPPEQQLAELVVRCRAERMGLLEVYPAADAAFAAARLAERWRQGGVAPLVAADRGGAAWRWDARCGQAVPLAHMRLFGDGSAGRPAIEWRGRSPAAAAAPDPRLARQINALGAAGQRALRGLTVAVVGCGGTGGLVAVLLALAGVGRLLLIDDDRVEHANRNRLVGATLADARRGTLKVVALRRYLGRLVPDVAVLALARSLYDARTTRAICAADLLMGCTDNEGSRLHMNALAVQHLLPYVDCGVGIERGPDGLVIGGQVRVVLPGGVCLECYEGIDRWGAAADLAAPRAQQRQRSHGYGLEGQPAAPSLAVLNAAIAAEAAASVVAIATGLRPVYPYLLYDLVAGQLVPRSDAQHSPSCPACARGRRFGRGDALPLPCPAADRELAPPPIEQRRATMIWV